MTSSLVRPGAGRRRPPSGPVTSRTVALAWLAAGALGGLAGLRALPRDGHRLQIAAEGVRDAVTTLAPVLVTVGVRRRRPGLVLLAAGLTAEAIRRRNWHRRPARADLPSPIRLRVVTANLLGGNRQVAALGRQLVDDGADVVVVQELTDAHVHALRAAGLFDAMPHQLLDPRPGYQGSAVFARWPISDATVLEFNEARMAAATVLAPGGPVRVVSVHAVNPAGAGMIPLWHAQLEALAGYAKESVIPVVLAGDYNATGDHRALGVLRAAGMVDAHDVAGRGLGLTWPRRSFTGHGRWPALPLMRLDHVFVSPGFGVRAVDTRASAGSDHRRVIAELTRPRGGA